VSGSLSQFENFAPDAFERAAEQLVPENIVLGEYAFIPWVRIGVIAGVKDERGPVRAEVTVSFDVQDDVGGHQSVQKTLTIRGPGDVLGFEAKQIIRRYPEPGTPNAENTYFAHVEFDRPDFPWLFTPFAPVANRLPPWMALVVLDAAHAIITSGVNGLPPTVQTRFGELQSLNDSWAWAHAQIIGAANSGPPVATRLSDAFGPVNLSRIICPRRLSPNKNYIACLVPAFDAGMKAALGVHGGTTDPAWTRVQGDDDHEITLPVFDHWSFSTAADGDFMSLAKKLVGIPAPWNVGRRVIDTSHPGFAISNLAPNDPGRTQIIKCALTAPSTARKPDGAPDDSESWNNAKKAELVTELNRPDDLTVNVGGAADEDLPIIGPRIYARYQRGASTVDANAMGDWFNELNLSPSNRVIAGLGTRVVQKDREQLMQAAWAQVGSIEAANREIRRAQSARFLGGSLHTRHLSKMTLGQLTQVTRGLQAKVKFAGAPLTVFGTAAKSAAAPAALTPAFRRVTRARGPIARYLDAPARVALSNLVANGAAIRDFRRQYVEPDGVASLSAVAQSGISAAAAARVLGVSEALALGQAAARVARFNQSPSAVDRLLAPPETWKPVRAVFDLGSLIASNVTADLHQVMPTRITSQPSRAEALAPLFEGIANSKTTSARSARESVHNIVQRLPIQHRVRLGANPPAAGQRIAAVEAIRYQSATALKLSTTISSARAISAASLVSGLSDFARGIGVFDLPPTPARPPLVVMRDTLLAAIHPKVTVTSHIQGRLTQRPAWLPRDWFKDGNVRPIMAAPVFEVPMFERLDAYNRDWLVPGLGKIPKPDFVTLLETNPKFTEAFLAGLSDEMGRELLWRGYPTDQRGTYFRRFWTPDQNELAQDVHRFTPTPLGTHLADAAGGIGRVVFVVRGELVKRYPTAVTLALRAIQPIDGVPTFADPDSPGGKAMATLLFHNFLPPDVLLVGFDLTEADLVPGRWWFVIGEHPTAPRFGVQDGAMPSLGAHSGITAHNAFREPIRAAFEATKLLAPARGGA
jgi:hypothetical protein